MAMTRYSMTEILTDAGRQGADWRHTRRTGMIETTRPTR
jgi:hypothetical protein